MKIRLQDRASAGKYNGMMDVVAKTVRNEGILAMYQGLESTMWRHILWNAGYFGCIFQVRQVLPKVETKTAQITNDIIAGSTLLCSLSLSPAPDVPDAAGVVLTGARSHRRNHRDDAQHSSVRVFCFCSRDQP